MSIDFIRPEVDELRPRISVIGVGGAGGNAVANMIANDVQGVDFIVANTDAQALNASPADHRIQLGPAHHPGPRRRLAPGDRQGRAEEALQRSSRRWKARTCASSPPAWAAAPAPARRR
jgi:cell division protein FtsZ